MRPNRTIVRNMRNDYQDQIGQHVDRVFREPIMCSLIVARDDREECMTPKGYDYGAVPHSPVTMSELAQLKATAGFTDADARALLRAGEILVPAAEAMVDEWRGSIGKQEYLSHWFVGPSGIPDDAYKSAVKPRFVQWVKDVCTRPFDQAWLDYQEEIGLRHTPQKKNKTDGIATPPLVPLRYILAFAPPILAAAHTRLANAEDAAEMQAAWTKAVMLTLTLWARPFARDGLW
jgi:hypothetical protein